jgi:hypothetical protein
MLTARTVSNWLRRHAGEAAAPLASIISAFAAEQEKKAAAATQSDFWRRVRESTEPSSTFLTAASVTKDTKRRPARHRRRARAVPRR